MSTNNEINKASVIFVPLIKISEQSTPTVLSTDAEEGSNSSQLKKRNRYNSFYTQHPVKINLNLEEKEEILRNISKQQQKMNNYNKEENSISSKKRENIYEWCHKLLDSTELSKIEKTSIFHRFCTAYDFVMEKLFIMNYSIREQEELKILIITIFLLAYKMEGLCIGKISISNLIDSFLNEIKMNKDELLNKVLQYEIKILELIDFNPQIIDDNNIYQLSYLIWDLYKKINNANLSEEAEIKIENVLNYLNIMLEFSDNATFDLFPIEKALISFYTSLYYTMNENENFFGVIKEFHFYLKNKMKIVNIADETIEEYVMMYNDILKKKGI